MTTENTIKLSSLGLKIVALAKAKLLTRDHHALFTVMPPNNPDHKRGFFPPMTLQKLPYKIYMVSVDTHIKQGSLEEVAQWMEQWAPEFAYVETECESIPDPATLEFYA